MKLKSLLLALLLIPFLCCCGDDKKQISPTETEFTSGGLSKLVEVVNEPCDLSYSKQDDSHYLRLQVKLKLKEETPKLQKMVAQDIELLGGMTISLVDENSNKLTDLRLKDELQLKKLLQGKKGDTAVIAFEEKTNDEAKDDFKKAEKFTPAKTGDVEGAAGLDGEYDLTGSVGKYPINMHLQIEGDDVDGYYRYTRGSGRLNLTGKNNDGQLDVNETNAEGQPTGHFVGKMQDGVFKGEFISYQGKRFPFVVTVAGADASALSDDNSDYSSDSDNSDSGSDVGSGDIDEALDAYERFIDRYCNLINRMAKGDAAAIAEYAGMLSEYTDFAKKMDAAKDEMSSSQLQRINRMTEKMTSALNKANQYQ